MVTLIRNAFPDLKFTVEDMIAEGDKLTARWTCRGTHRGELMGVPPKGKSVSIEVIDVILIVNGEFAEHWGLFDNMGMMQQLGAIPEPGVNQG